MAILSKGQVRAAPTNDMPAQRTFDKRRLSGTLRAG